MTKYANTPKLFRGTKDQPKCQQYLWTQPANVETNTVKLQGPKSRPLPTPHSHRPSTNTTSPDPSDEFELLWSRIGHLQHHQLPQNVTIEKKTQPSVQIPPNFFEVPRINQNASSICGHNQLMLKPTRSNSRGQKVDLYLPHIPTAPQPILLALTRLMSLSYCGAGSATSNTINYPKT